MLAAGVPELRRLPLHELHAHHEARMIPFAHYQMPVSYRHGVLKEHLHTRACASLFDVSHMGQILLRPRDHSTMHDVALALQSIMPIDVVSLKHGRQRYGFLTTDSGGIRDDLMIANLGPQFLLIVNASCKAEDEAYISERVSRYTQVQSLSDRVLLALQGPRAAEVLIKWAPEIAHLRFMDAAEISVDSVACWVMRSGYTGEDGFEISVPIEAAMSFARRLLANPLVKLAGLGARDSLRLEAGLCLHGADIDVNITPVQAALEWVIPPARRAGGPRAGGFPGADIVLAQLRHGAPTRRVGLRSEHRPVRAPAALFLDETSDLSVGRVTSGGFGPSLNSPIAMGYVSSAHTKPDTHLWADVRGHRYAVTVAELPFVVHRYQR
jgi:aminomethyltransferase